jgi:glyoxylase-like metal-dependent hydrolase (beta-lactamase superfamily II)
VGDASEPERPWTEPGAWRVAPGVVRIPLPLPTDGLKAVNVYVLDEPDGLTLIDGGWAIPESREVLDKALQLLGRTTADITRVLVTHIHRDHYTQAVTLRRDSGAIVSLGAGERPSLEALNNPMHHSSQVAYLRESGAPALSAFWRSRIDSGSRDLSMWESPDHWLSGDSQIELGSRALDAIETPGHTRGHLVFADRAAGLLFAGDHVLPTITPSIGFEPVPPALPLADYLGSLAKVRALPDLTLLPAHGQHGGSVHDRVDALLAHHDDRLRRCLEAATGRVVTAHEVAGDLPWTGRDRPFDSLDAYNAALAVLETRAHLEVLVARDDATRAVVDGVARYGAVTRP